MQFVEDFILNRRNGIVVFIREDKVYGGVQGITHLDKGREGDFDTVIFNVADMAHIDIGDVGNIFLCQVLGNTCIFELFGNMRKIKIFHEGLLSLISLIVIFV